MVGEGVEEACPFGNFCLCISMLTQDGVERLEIGFFNWTPATPTTGTIAWTCCATARASDRAETNETHIHYAGIDALLAFNTHRVAWEVWFHSKNKPTDEPLKLTF